MGYYTAYTLTWKPVNNGKSFEFPACPHDVPATDKFCPECGVKNVPVLLGEKVALYIKANEEMSYCLSDEGDSDQAGKWYDHEKDMRDMSKKFYGVLFTLHGEGEESGDIWNKYFLNGKCQVANARIVIDKFDLAMMS